VFLNSDLQFYGVENPPSAEQTSGDYAESRHFHLLFLLRSDINPGLINQNCEQNPRAEMSNFYGASSPPPIPYGSRPQVTALRRPSQPSVDASLLDLTRKNAVYYPNYRVYRGETPATLNYNCISHVFYAFAHVSPDGGVFVSNLL
jgi:hypothetical protein